MGQKALQYFHRYKAFHLSMADLAGEHAGVDVGAILAETAEGGGGGSKNRDRAGWPQGLVGADGAAAASDPSLRRSPSAGTIDHLYSRGRVCRWLGRRRTCAQGRKQAVTRLDQQPEHFGSSADVGVTPAKTSSLAFDVPSRKQNARA
jgi:hypothetical protein